MVYKMELTYNEIVNMLGVKYIAVLTTGYTLAPGTYKINDITLMLKSLFTDKVKVSFTNEDILLRSISTTNKAIGLLKKLFSTNQGLTHTHSGPLGDIDGNIQLTRGTHKSKKPINNTGIDKIHLKCDCSNGSFVKGNRQLILFSSVLDKPPGHKTYKEPRTKLFKRINNFFSVSYNIFFGK